MTLAERFAATFDGQGAMRTIGAQLAAIDEGSCVLELPYSDAVTQQHGFFHGGIIGMLADVAGGCACATMTPEGAQVLTVEYKINFLAPAAGVTLRATGRVIRAGRTLLIAAVDVATISAEGAIKQVAVAQQTIMAVPPDRLA